MPGASVKVGPVRVGSGCCVALVIPVLVAVVIGVLVLSGIAFGKQYVLKHPKREHCRAHYVKKVKTIKKQNHRHVVKTLCIYVTPKKVSITTAAPTTSTTPISTPSTSIVPPSPVVALYVHLDSNFVQSTTNPLAITYHYGASATVGAENEPILPVGVLSLYANGSLVCSTKIGGSITESECSVTYSTTGSQTVMVSYSSSFASVSESYNEDVEPFTTHTFIEEPKPIECNKEEKLSPLGATATKDSWCKYIIKVITENKYDAYPPKKGVWLTFPNGAGYHRFEDNIEIGKSYEAVLTFGEIFGLKEIKESESCILKIGGNIYAIKEVSDCHHLPVVASYEGSELVGGKYSWLASETEITLED